MNITILFPPGFTAEGIVLSANEDWMRVAVKGWDDAAEFRNDDGQWVAENGDAVVIQRQAAAAAMRTQVFRHPHATLGSAMVSFC